jgi:ATP-dependent DNA helicase 2 subunit 1
MNGWFLLLLTEDIRTLDIHSTVKADAEQVRIAKAVIKKLKFTYKPFSFDNPKLQTHWRNIEALALDYNERTEVEDHTGNVSFTLIQLLLSM